MQAFFLLKRTGTSRGGHRLSGESVSLSVTAKRCWEWSCRYYVTQRCCTSDTQPNTGKNKTVLYNDVCPVLFWFHQSPRCECVCRCCFKLFFFSFFSIPLSVALYTAWNIDGNSDSLTDLPSVWRNARLWETPSPPPQNTSKNGKMQWWIFGNAPQNNNCV